MSAPWPRNCAGRLSTGVPRRGAGSLVFDHELAAVYDVVYQARGQDFSAEAELVTETILARRPEATSLLDVGCGTGEHLKTLSKLFNHVEGVDLSPSMVAVARAKLPSLDVHLEDMCELDLGRTFDAVISLSTAVAYLPSLAALHRALERMVQHLSPGGVLVVEPWYFPENFLDGHVAGDLLRVPEHTISRVSHTQRRGGAAYVVSHYVIADRHGIEHFTETHVFRLWSRDEYVAAFRGAGCTAEYIEGVQSGRGIFVGERG
ncbi:MAG TPA: SAM-dependent methyltransferase [Micromonosporaceae bacterium]|nr:SAM-dependent methyltransferase [Micromonosporaceae bacterium]